MTERARFRHREVFFAHNGTGPYKCFECDEVVLFDDITVHHLNHDGTDNTPSNLVAAHFGCHMSYHASARRGIKWGPYTGPKWTHTEETKERIRQSKLGTKHTAETKALIAAKATGRKLTPEQRMRLSEAQRGRVLSDATKQRMSEAALRRWAKKRETA